MARGPRYAVKFRRRLEGKTNYPKRLNLLKSGEIRLIIRRSNKYIICQLIEYKTKGDKVLAAFHSSQLKKSGWKYDAKNLPAAYLSGYVIGKAAKSLKIKSAVLDAGLTTSTKGSKIYAAVKGAIDAGLEVPVGEEILPTEDRISGKHIVTFKKNLKNITADFEKIKSKLSRGS